MTRVVPLLCVVVCALLSGCGSGGLSTPRLEVVRAVMVDENTMRVELSLANGGGRAMEIARIDWGMRVDGSSVAEGGWLLPSDRRVVDGGGSVTLGSDVDLARDLIAGERPTVEVDGTVRFSDADGGEVREAGFVSGGVVEW